MAVDFNIKRHDTAPAIQAQFLDDTGTPVDITGSSVTFIMAAVGSNVPKVNAAATIVLASSGTVSYSWTGTDTDTSGTFNAEWQVIYPSGKKQTFPDPGYTTVVITDDLDNA